MGILQFVGDARAVAMLGMCKNAGKTTALNRLLRECARAGRTVGLTSVGRDGEGRDLVTGTDKPPIYLYEGMLAATAEQLLPLCDISREILETTGLSTSLGQVVLFRARSDGFAQLAGPAIVEQLAPLRESFEAFGADCVLIDGALSRRSPAAGAADGCCILSTGASLDRDLEKVVAETAFAARLLTLPELEPPGETKAAFTLFAGGEGRPAADTEDLCAALKGTAGERTVCIGGALTEARARSILRSGAKLEGLTLLAADGSRYLLARETFERLTLRGVRWGVRQSTRLAAVTVNPVSAGGWTFDGTAFLEKMRGAVDVPVLDVGKYAL